MKWKHPPITKIYEAIGSVADGRVEVNGDSGKVYSSSRNKYYDINFDPNKKAIMSNDNASYWKGYMGYPSIAFLMAKGLLSYDENLGQVMKGVAWKDINQKFKNDFDKALEYILSSKSEAERRQLREFVDKVNEELGGLDLSLLGEKIKPPSGY